MSDASRLSAVLFLLAAPCWSASPRADASVGPRHRIDTIIAELDRLARKSKDQHPLEAKQSESLMRAFLPEIRAMGTEAVEALGSALGDPDRPFKARLYAAAFLGLHGDPGGFKALRECALDPFDIPGVRSAALQAMASVRVGPVTRRKILERVLANESVPPVVRSEALDQLGELGAADPSVVVSAAALPALRAGDARNAARAIAKSKSSAAPAAMLALLPSLETFPEAEIDALAGLTQLPRASLSLDETEALLKILRRREGKPAAWAARAIAKLRPPEAADELRRSLRARDPLVITESAEGLARLRDPKGAKAIALLAENLSSDKRFTGSSLEDIPVLAARIHAAAAEASSPASPGAMPSEEPPAAKALSPAERRTPVEFPGSEELRRGAFRFDGYPGDSRPAILWPGGTARLYEKPDPAAKSRRVPLPKGELNWDASLVWTLEPGGFTVRRPLLLDVEDFGAFSGRYSGAPGRKRRQRLRNGEMLTLLGVRQSGECFVERRGRLLAMECPQFFPGPYEVAHLPVVEWWVRVQGGWLTTSYEQSR